MCPPHHHGSPVTKACPLSNNPLTDVVTTSVLHRQQVEDEAATYSSTVRN